MTSEIRNNWLAKRTKGIGGSDIASILGIDSFRTPLDVFNSKVNNFEQEDNIFLASGRALEPVIANFYAKENNIMIIEPDQDLYVSKINPVFLASIDRFFIDNNEKKILEIKDTTKDVMEINPAHYCQVQWYFSVTELDKAVIVYLDKYKRLIPFDIQRNDELINHLQSKAMEFWNNHVLTNIPPEPVNSDDLMKLYHTVKAGKSIEVVDEVFNSFIELKNVKAEIKELESIKESLEFELKSVMKDAEIMTYSNKIIATYKQFNQNRVDSDMLKNQYPDVYEKCIKTSSYRKLDLKKV